MNYHQQEAPCVNISLWHHYDVNILMYLLAVVAEALELGWVFRADIGSLTAEVLRILHATHQTVHPAVA